MVGDVVCWIGDEDRESWVVLAIDPAKSPPVFVQREADGLMNAFNADDLLRALPLPNGSRGNVAHLLRTPEELAEMSKNWGCQRELPMSEMGMEVA